MGLTGNPHPELGPTPSPRSNPEAVANQPETAEAGEKSRNLNRLKRIEGQVRGLQRMLEQARPCPEIITQVASVQEALRSVARELVRSHLHEQLEEAASAGAEEQAAALDAALDMVYKHLR